MGSKELQLVQENHGMKTYSEGRIELRNLQFLKKMLEKSSPFLSLDQPSEPKSWDVALNVAGVEKYARKLAIAVNLEATRFELWMEMSVICVLCDRWFSNQFEIVSDTPLKAFSCDTVSRELLWAELCSLLCPEMDGNNRIGKQGYVFILFDVKKFVLIDVKKWNRIKMRFRIPNINQSVNDYFESEKSWIY